MSTDLKRRKQTSKRRRSILDASLRCFLRHGVEAATIEQIRDASGASSGSIYHHFGSKQAIAVALYVEGMEELAELYRAAMQGQTSLEAGLRAIVRSYFQWVVKNRDWAMYLLRVATADLSADDAAHVDELNRRTRQALSAWLCPFAERGELIDVPDDLYTSLVFGPLTHFARHWLAGRLKIDPAVAARHFATTVWLSLTGGTSERTSTRAKAATLPRGLRTKKDSRRSKDHANAG
ncbi:MAG: TetR/AcrR family transcriptional regulator [Planctomycetes bacterium]|nr:TetR/AcrR family transcriptional regulator [Planctomycetota bacterium]